LSDEIRYGVIGSGVMGLEHINNVNAIDGARVVAISEPDAGSRKFGKHVAGIDDDAVFETHTDLLAAGVCDAVVLVSLNHTHAERMPVCTRVRATWGTSTSSMQSATARLRRLRSRTVGSPWRLEKAATVRLTRADQSRCRRCLTVRPPWQTTSKRNPGRNRP
jgi:hypothetical protein